MSNIRSKIVTMIYRKSCQYMEEMLSPRRTIVKAPTMAMSKFAIAAMMALTPFPIAEHTLPWMIRYFRNCDLVDGNQNLPS